MFYPVATFLTEIFLPFQWSSDDSAKFDRLLDDDIGALLAAMVPEVEKIDEFIEDNADMAKRDIVVNQKLKNHDPNRLKLHKNIDQSIPGLFKGTVVAVPRFQFHNLPVEDKGNAPLPGHLFHKNMLAYLTIAYDAHMSVVLSPDMVFYTLLCELGDAIKGAPDLFAKVFTLAPGEKTPVFTYQSDPADLNVEELANKLEASIPIDGSAFRGSFTTTDKASRLALNAAFADAMGAYHYYVGGLCGIPRVRLLGSKGDWQQIEAKLEKWEALLFPKNPDRDADDDDQPIFPLQSWLYQARACVHDIHTKRDPTFWAEMYTLDRCSCGTTDAVTGWISRLFRTTRAGRRFGKWHYHGRDFYNYDSHISTVAWTNLDNHHSYSLFTGLLYSTIKAPETQLDEKYPFLEPHFAHLVRDETASPLTDEDYTRYLVDLPYRDRNFMEKNRQYLTSNVILSTGDSRLHQRHEILLNKYRVLSERALLGDFKVTHLKLNYWSNDDYGYLQLPGESGSWNYAREPAERERVMSLISKTYPIIPQVMERLFALLASGSIQELHLEGDSLESFFLDQHMSYFQNSAITTLTLEGIRHAHAARLLLSSPPTLERLTLKFSQSEYSIEFMSALRDASFKSLKSLGYVAQCLFVPS